MSLANTPPTLPVAINFTSNAANKVRALIDEEGNPNLKLRVFITGGGCSGFQYGFAFEEKINDDDAVIEKEVSDKISGTDAHRAVQLLIDPMSYQYLVGAEIDYVEDTRGEQFVIRNPNAQTTCGCGSSFTINDEKDEDEKDESDV